MVLYALGTVEPCPDTKPLYDKDKENELMWEALSCTRWLTCVTSFHLSYNSTWIVLLYPEFPAYNEQPGA